MTAPCPFGWAVSSFEEFDYTALRVLALTCMHTGFPKKGGKISWKRRCICICIYTWARFVDIFRDIYQNVFVHKHKYTGTCRSIEMQEHVCMDVWENRCMDMKICSSTGREI